MGSHTNLESRDRDYPQDAPGAVASTWGHMFQAPHDAPVRLFLPAHKWKADEHGRPLPDSVEHGECIGVWDEGQSHWVNRDTRAKVYPSGWKAINE